MAIPAILTLAASQGTRAAVKKYGKKAVDEALKSRQGQKFKKNITKKYGPKPKSKVSAAARANRIKTDFKQDKIKKAKVRKTSRSLGTKGIAVAGISDIKRRRKQKGK